MNKKICDRCGEEISGTTYYTIDIYGQDINPTNDDRVSVTTAGQNIYENMRKIQFPERCYCNNCKSDIESFIHYKPYREPNIEEILGVKLKWWQKFLLELG